MSEVQAFFLGVMAVLTPSLLIMAWMLWDVREEE